MKKTHPFFTNIAQNPLIEKWKQHVAPLMLIILIQLSSCKDPYANISYIDSITEFPIATYLEDNSEKYSLWVELLKQSNLYNSLNLNANYTCFVPDNDAVTAYLTEHNVSSVASISKEDAAILVKYHTIKGKMYVSTDFENGTLPDSTATGDFLNIQNEGLNAIQINNEATIIGLDKKLTNGVVHTINHLLTPITETITDKLEKNTSYSIFKDAVIATGYSEMLDKISVSEITSDGKIIVRKYKYTLLAVPNSVFSMANVTDVNSLATYLGATSTDYTNNTNPLNLYISYHIIPQLLSFNDLATFSSSPKSKNISTLAGNELINISEVNNLLYINYNKATSNGIQLSAINKNCKNGILHEVDNITPIAVPEATTVQWEFTNFPYIAATYATYYRKTSLTTSFTGWLNNEVNGKECYKWLSVPEDRIGAGYFVCDKNASEMKKALYSDYLTLQLGMFGWIQMEMPAIIKGKYTVALSHFSRLAASPGSKLSLIIDGVYVGTQVSTSGYSNKIDTYRSVSMGTVQFSDTKKHIIKILGGDDGVAYLDFLTFTPTK